MNAENNCQTGKRCYPNAAAAKNELVHFRARKGGETGRLQVYHCMRCNRFHLGRPPGPRRSYFVPIRT